MEAFFVSLGVVTVAEIGDKTQLLALLLAARFRKPVAIIAGILLATLANHWAAGAAGAWVSGLVSPDILKWAVGLSFLAVAAWALIPDKIDDDESPRGLDRYGAFFATLVAFFLVEIGDKTQIATIVLAARYESLMAVVSGTTLGMLAANVPAVLAGEFAANRLPLTWIRRGAALTFAILGVLTLLGFGDNL